MKRLLLYTCYILLITTLLLYFWLVWRRLTPDEVLIPASIIYFGLSFRRAFRLYPALERWYALQMAKLTGKFLFAIFSIYHLTHMALLLCSSLSGLPEPTPFLASFFQDAFEVVYWGFALCMVLLVLVRLSIMKEEIE